jgi:hypothetical protein
MVLDVILPCQINARLYVPANGEAEVAIADDEADQKIRLEVAERIAFGYVKARDKLPADIAGVIPKFVAYGNGAGPCPTVADLAPPKKGA